MTERETPIAGFRAAFTVVGTLYVLMASSMLVRGVGAMRDFAVPEELVTAPVFEDFFLFFYQFMAFIGVLKVVIAWTVRGRRDQVVVAGVFCVANVLFGFRDLSTSDSALGNRLYKGEATMMFVVIDVVLALVFGYLAIRGLRTPRSAQRRPA